MPLWTEGSHPATSFTEGTPPETTFTEGTPPATTFTEGSPTATTFTEGSPPSTSWEEESVVQWGVIEGTLSNQEDLQTALDAKLALAGGTMAGAIAMGGNAITGAAGITGTLGTFSTGVNTAEIYNSAGDLKVMPDVQGNVVLFGDAGAGDNCLAKITGYITAASAAKYASLAVLDTDDMFHIARQDANILGLSVDMPLNVSTITAGAGADLTLKLGDAAGANKLSITDSGDVVVGHWDSYGRMDFANATCPNGTTFFDASGVAVNVNQSSYLFKFPGLTYQYTSGLSFVLSVGSARFGARLAIGPSQASPNQRLFLKFEDAAGADAFVLQDSTGAGVGSWDSDGNIQLAGEIEIDGALNHDGATAGFYGTAPIAQAVLATGAGATVDNVITALQNLGLVKQA